MQYSYFMNMILLLLVRYIRLKKDVVAHYQNIVKQVNTNLRTLQNCLTSLMGRPITLEQLKLDVGLVVEKMTQITCVFRRIQLRMEEYVCLKVYILLNQGKN